MDKITIRNKRIYLSRKSFGKHFDKIRCFDGSKKFKYRLENKNKDYSLILIINNTKRGFTVKGSIRKWWFGSRLAIRDFDYKNFNMCINELANAIGISKSKFWESGVTSLEIGGNIKLGAEYKHIISSMNSFPNLGQVTFMNQTKYFKGANYEVVAYNKLLEVFKKSNLKISTYKKIEKAIFILRFEVRLRKPSGTKLKSKINTLNGIKNNWLFLIDYWKETYEKISFNKIQNPKLVSKNEYLSRTELKEFCITLVAEHFGIGFLDNIVNVSCRPNHKSSEKKYIRDVCKKFETEDFDNYKNHVFDAVAKKAELMKRFSLGD